MLNGSWQLGLNRVIRLSNSVLQGRLDFSRPHLNLLRLISRLPCATFAANLNIEVFWRACILENSQLLSLYLELLLVGHWAQIKFTADPVVVITVHR